MTTEALTAIKAAGSADRWSIDHSAGRPILMLDGCSVIEAEDAEYLLRLIKRDQANGKTAEEIIQASVDLEIADHPNGHWTTEQVKRVAARSIAAALSPTVGTGEERQTPAPPTHVDAPDALELRYREGFEDGEKHAADELALAQSYRDTYKRVLDELQERGLTPGTIDIIKERRRQIASEGWTVEHDDAHVSEELATAASCYLRPDLRTVTISADRVTFGDPWPWWNEWNDGGRCAGREKAWWKPTDRRRDLVKAAALIIAEIERIDRAATTEGQP